MATPSYPQEDNQEKTSLPCCKTLSLEGRWRNQISATLQGSTLGTNRERERNDRIMPCPTGGGCNKNIVTLWHVCGYSQLPSDEAKRRHNANSLYMKLMMLKSTSFFWGGGDMEFIGQIPPSNHPWASVTSALTQGTVREQLRKNSGPFLSQAKSPPKLCDFLSCFSCFCCGRR